MTNFFASQLLAQLDDKDPILALEEALAESRKVGFDYADDQEALEHFRSETREVEEAFQGDSPEDAVHELGDLVVILTELVRRRGGSLSVQAKESVRKFLTRLAYVEDLMRQDGKTWDDVGTWKDDVKPNYWDKAKAAGL
jgi:tetrapyrrole methylase family protein/MazG family protein